MGRRKTPVFRRAMATRPSRAAAPALYLWIASSRTGSGSRDDVRDSSQTRHAIGALARSANSAEDCRDVTRELFGLLARRIAAHHSKLPVDQELGEIPLDRLGAQEARRFRERGFAVLGFPCDQFGHQEPGDEAAIRKFCTEKYDVTFPMFAKIEVNGANAHPLFQTLKQDAPGLLGTQAIKWNFTKFLIDRQLRVLRRYAPSKKPEKLSDDIAAILG